MDTQPKIKLAYITGLRQIVLDEIKSHSELRILSESYDSVYLEHTHKLDEIRELRSVARAYLVVQNSKYNPHYVSNHKSIIGDLISIITYGNKRGFKTFKITCAGSDSEEVREISKYIQNTFTLEEAEEADLKVHIIKLADTWEVGAQITPRPLSVRDYKVQNMSGAMDPTIAYAMNHLCSLQGAQTYLNPFSGSGTLLIEAGQSYPHLEQLVGFDKDKKHLSLAVQNIKKAGLIKKIQIHEADIFDKPDFGKFDVIASDLPFGMSISKDEDLEKLYGTFVEYCEGALNDNGTLAIYTSEHEILERAIQESNFKIIENLELKFMTSVDAYLRPRILVCKLDI
jgi:tRNA (guanine6-N2)-methyltransferase